MRWLVEESINQHIQEEETISLKTSQQILTNVVCMFQGQLLQFTLLFYIVGWIIYIIIKHVHTNKKIIFGDVCEVVMKCYQWKTDSKSFSKFSVVLCCSCFQRIQHLEAHRCRKASVTHVITLNTSTSVLQSSICGHTKVPHDIQTCLNTAHHLGTGAVMHT